MEQATYIAIANTLEALGPYGLVLFFAIVFWKMSERKDRELKAIYERFAQTTEEQTKAMIHVQAALVSVKDAIERFARR